MEVQTTDLDLSPTPGFNFYKSAETVDLEVGTSFTCNAHLYIKHDFEIKPGDIITIKGLNKMNDGTVTIDYEVNGKAFWLQKDMFRNQLVLCGCLDGIEDSLARSRESISSL